jgi:subtilisin family serine protease
MPRKLGNLHSVLGLVLSGLLLTAFPFCASSRVVAQDSVLNGGSDHTAGRDRGPRTMNRDSGERTIGRDRGGSHGRMGGFGSGLGIGLGGAILEQLTAPRPANGSVEKPQSIKKKNATRGNSAVSKDGRVSGRNTTIPKNEPSVSQQPAGASTGRQSGIPPRGERRFVADEVILEFAPGATPQAIDQLARRYNLTQLESQSFPLIGSSFSRWHIAGGRSVPNVVGVIEDERIVASAQPNYLFALQEDAANSGAANTAAPRGEAAQYVLAKLQIGEAHQVATGKNILVAVIDSQIDAKHPDLYGAIAKSLDELGGAENPPQHGTAIAGAIAAHGKLLGIAPGVQLLAERAFDDTPGKSKGTSFAIYKSLQAAADGGARVVNMSFVGPADPALHRMLAAAYAKDMVLIAAAGNAGPDAAPFYPAADPDVIAVTASDSHDGLFKMANRGAYIAVAAPGVDILALAPGDAYQIISGTSVAAAHVSGIAALLLEHQTTLKPIDVRSILMTTAKPLATGKRTDFGAGLVNAYRALTQSGDKSVGIRTRNRPN